MNWQVVEVTSGVRDDAVFGAPKPDVGDGRSAFIVTKSIHSPGIDPTWPSVKTLLCWLDGIEPSPMDDVVAYNARSDADNVRNLPPSTSYRISGGGRGAHAQLLMFQGKPWEHEMLAALGYSMLGDQLHFFWHGQFRKLFPDHPQPLRMMDWESMVDRMAMAFAIGRTDEGIYDGYLTHGALNRQYQLEISYEQKHRCGLAFMLRLFADWRGDVSHAWPDFAYAEPIYEAILGAWRSEDPDALVPLLLAACDRHTYEGHPDKEEVFYDFRSMPRTPVEILLLFRLRELCGLKNPHLDHPLMASSFDRMPESQPAYVPDELVLGTLARVREDWPEIDSVLSFNALR